MRPPSVKLLIVCAGFLFAGLWFAWPALTPMRRAATRALDGLFGGGTNNRTQQLDSTITALRDSASRLRVRSDAAQAAEAISHARFDSLDRNRRAESERNQSRIKLWRDSASALHGLLAGVIYHDPATGVSYVPLDTLAAIVDGERQRADTTIRACRVTILDCERRATLAEGEAAVAVVALATMDTARTADHASATARVRRAAAAGFAVGLIAGLLRH